VTRFRYYFSDAAAKYAPGKVTVSFVADRWGDVNGNLGLAGTRTFNVNGPTGDLSNPQGAGSIDINTLNGRNWIDVTFPSGPAGYTLDEDSLLDLASEFTLGGPGLGTVAIDSSQAPVILSRGANPVVRYWVKGVFASGDVSLTFLTGTWSYKSNASASIPDLILLVEDPQFLDITFPGAPAGFAIDPGSITDLAAEFTLTFVRRIQVSSTTSQMPVDSRSRAACSAVRHRR